MSEQPGFDFEAAAARRAEAIRQRDAGIQTAIDHANAVEPTWGEQAYTQLLRFVGHHAGEFMGEDVRAFARAAGVPPPPDNRAWGSVMLRAARAGLIRKIGWSTAKDPKVHCNPASLWVRS